MRREEEMKVILLFIVKLIVLLLHKLVFSDFAGNKHQTMSDCKAADNY